MLVYNVRILFIDAFGVNDKSRPISATHGGINRGSGACLIEARRGADSVGDEAAASPGKCGHFVDVSVEYTKRRSRLDCLLQVASIRRDGTPLLKGFRYASARDRRDCFQLYEASLPPFQRTVVAYAAEAYARHLQDGGKKFVTLGRGNERLSAEFQRENYLGQTWR
jgi:hypothetical protein